MPSYDFTYTLPGFPTVSGRHKGAAVSSSDGNILEMGTERATQHTHLRTENGAGKVGKRRRPSRKKDPANPESLIRRLVANTQERNRMHGLNDALDRLRRHIPWHLSSRRMSKIKTLRLAMAYIEALTDMIQGSTRTLSYPDSEDSCHDKTDESNATDEDAGKGGRHFSGQAATTGKRFFGRRNERGNGRMRGHGKGAGRPGPQVTRPNGCMTDIQGFHDRVTTSRVTS